MEGSGLNPRRTGLWITGISSSLDGARRSESRGCSTETYLVRGKADIGQRPHSRIGGIAYRRAARGPIRPARRAAYGNTRSAGLTVVCLPSPYTRLRPFSLFD